MSPSGTTSGGGADSFRPFGFFFGGSDEACMSGSFSLAWCGRSLW